MDNDKLKKNNFMGHQLLNHIVIYLSTLKHIVSGDVRVLPGVEDAPAPPPPVPVVLEDNSVPRKKLRRDLYRGTLTQGMDQEVLDNV